MHLNTVITFYGAAWCYQCRVSKKILEENNIVFNYIDLDINIDAAEKVIEINRGMQSIPTIIFPDGTILVEPSSEELVETLKQKELLS